MSKEQVGGFRDDLLGVTRATPRQADILKKKMGELFRRNGFGIVIKVNQKHVDFLDVHFDLNTGIFSPYAKEGEERGQGDASPPPSYEQCFPRGIEDVEAVAFQSHPAPPGTSRNSDQTSEDTRATNGAATNNISPEHSSPNAFL